MTERFTYLAIACGSALGGMGRYWIAQILSQGLREKFPWAILVVNVSGSFLIGGLAAISGAGGKLPLNYHRFIAHFLMVGVCGGYTTFSTFSLETLRLMQTGNWLLAWANIGLSVGLCLFGVWAGLTLGHWVGR